MNIITMDLYRLSVDLNWLSYDDYERIIEENDLGIVDFQTEVSSILDIIDISLPGDLFKILEEYMVEHRSGSCFEVITNYKKFKTCLRCPFYGGSCGGRDCKNEWILDFDNKIEGEELSDIASYISNAMGFYLYFKYDHATDFFHGLTTFLLGGKKYLIDRLFSEEHLNTYFNGIYLLDSDKCEMVGRSLCTTKVDYIKEIMIGRRFDVEYDDYHLDRYCNPLYSDRDMYSHIWNFSRMDDIYKIYIRDCCLFKNFVKIKKNVYRKYSNYYMDSIEFKRIDRLIDFGIDRSELDTVDLKYLQFGGKVYDKYKSMIDYEIINNIGEKYDIQGLILFIQTIIDLQLDDQLYMKLLYSVRYGEYIENIVVCIWLKYLDIPRNIGYQPFKHPISFCLNGEVMKLLVKKNINSSDLYHADLYSNSTHSGDTYQHDTQLVIGEFSDLLKLVSDNQKFAVTKNFDEEIVKPHIDCLPAKDENQIRYQISSQIMQSGLGIDLGYINVTIIFNICKTSGRSKRLYNCEFYGRSIRACNQIDEDLKSKLELYRISSIEKLIHTVHESMINNNKKVDIFMFEICREDYLKIFNDCQNGLSIYQINTWVELIQSFNPTDGYIYSVLISCWVDGKTYQYQSMKIGITTSYITDAFSD